ncbi:GNAT family N-acetyltransferase [Streptomyces sp. NBC_00846]|uniref:GNAT family N-acetyltransferase n=2 Tax=Streptomyces TaxID=1883 RepID=UPI00386DE5A8|nr:GNAT family N-acetyltransferase [Streptomyces sp. NBC_00846]
MSDSVAEANEAGRKPCWRGRKVAFVPVEVDDAELLQEWRSDPATAHAMGIWPRSLTSLRERIERYHDDQDRDDFVVVLPDGTPVGHVALTEQDVADGTAEVELMLAPQHRGRGYGTDAVDALTDLAFGELPMYRLQAVTHTDNAAALAVLVRSGFVQEGIRRSACLHRGRRHDVAVLSLLRPEWEALARPKPWDR